MCSLDVCFSVACVFNIIYEFLTLKITPKTHSTEKRTSKQHIENATLIDPLEEDNFFVGFQDKD
jgi:hypothetical protein